MFREALREEQHRGDRSVLLYSHILAEVEALCDQLTIIRDGRAVETGTLADLRHLTRTSIQAELAAPPDGLADLPGVHLRGQPVGWSAGVFSGSSRVHRSPGAPDAAASPYGDVRAPRQNG